MKMKQKLKSKGSTNPKTMPADLRDKLNGLTINEAIERGFLDDLGDAEGNFIFEHADENIDAHYAICNGYAVVVSKGLAEKLEETEDIMGDLRFTKGVSNVDGDGFGKEYFRLGLPAGINLGESVLKLATEPVEA